MRAEYILGVFTNIVSGLDIVSRLADKSVDDRAIFINYQRNVLKKMIFLERTEAKDLNAEYRAVMLESVLKLLYENGNN